MRRLTNTDLLPVGLLHVIAERLRTASNGIEPTLDDILEEIAMTTDAPPTTEPS